MASVDPLQRPLLPADTDDKVDAKVEPDQLPPSYQAASEAPAPPPTDSESRCCRRRRRCRRIGHFFIALFVLWLTARYIVRHCQIRRFDNLHPHPHPHADGDSPWVRYLTILVELN